MSTCSVCKTKIESKTKGVIWVNTCKKCSAIAERHLRLYRLADKGLYVLGSSSNLQEMKNLLAKPSFMELYADEDQRIGQKQVLRKFIDHFESEGLAEWAKHEETIKNIIGGK